jgi:2-polyprenyl-3-methyl-5-hydroxy-6-metoxy-1,4-benzoquinol methylase
LKGDIRSVDNVSIEIQNRLAKVNKYNEWIYNSVKAFVGKRILDVGCASGNITQFFLDKELVIGLDSSPEFIEIINEKFQTYPNFKAVFFDITNSNVISLRTEKIDTITCFNVLEHIENDLLALSNMRQLLIDKGRLILLVPAFEFLYGTMDEADNHYRRYSKREISEKLRDSGFAVEKQFYMNAVGIIGWYINGKILRKTLVSNTHYSLYNKMVPVFSKVERIIPMPLGLSIIIIARRKTSE